MRLWSKKIAIKGSHGKAYPGWSWPIPPARDEELRQAFLKLKVSDSNSVAISWNAETHRRRSDSSVGSGDPKWDLHPIDDEIL